MAVKWTKEAVAKEAKKYKIRSAFKKGCWGAYDAARQYGWLDEVCSHMESRTPKGYWTKERCYDEAQKYYNRSTFVKSSAGAYHAACKKGWLDDICQHMEFLNRPNGYWSKERCQEEALKYTTRSDFDRGSRGAYTSALINDWLDDICQHMETKGHDKDDPCVVYEFEHRTKSGKCIVYIGITRAIFVRGTLDVEKTIRLRYSKGEELQKMVFSNYGILPRVYGSLEGMEGHVVSRAEALLVEKDSISQACDDGHIVLNTLHRKTKLCKNELISILNAEELHGFVNWEERLLEYVPAMRWTKDICRKEALKFSSKSEFKRCCDGAYQAAVKNKWIIDICGHMKRPLKWTKERCKDEALKYTTKGAFKKGSPNAYNASSRRKWLDEFFQNKES